MKRFLAVCAAGVMAVSLAASASAAQKKDDKKAPAARKSEAPKAEKKSGRMAGPPRAIHGNPGMHYGSHYNVYTMHIPQPPAEQK